MMTSAELCSEIIEALHEATRELDYHAEREDNAGLAAVMTDVARAIRNALVKRGL